MEAKMAEKATILIVEDEADIRDVLRYNLEREGFRVSSSANGEEGLKRVQRERPSLVLLDLMLPGEDGLEICRKLKGSNDTRSIPVIMVTAKGEESDIVLGLGMGADDYVTKPFSPREVVARVKAVLRRGSPIDEEEIRGRAIHCEGVVIDPAGHEVQVDGSCVEFTATEFRLLYHLASRPDRVFTREQLLKRAIGEEVIVLARNIDVHIRSVRQKLGPHRDLIKTIRGVGYRWMGKA